MLIELIVKDKSGV